MPKAKAPNPRVDGNANLRRDYRTPWITGYIDRARAAGVPDHLLVPEGGDESWYSEAIIQCATACKSRTLTRWERVRILEGLAASLRLGLEEIGATGDGSTPVPADDALLPVPMIRLQRLRARTLDNARGAEGTWHD